MKTKEKTQERKVWLKERTEKVLTQLISDLAIIQPENIIQFIYEWAFRHLQSSQNQTTNTQVYQPKTPTHTNLKPKIEINTNFKQKKFPT